MRTHRYGIVKHAHGTKWLLHKLVAALYAIKLQHRLSLISTACTQSQLVEACLMHVLDVP